MKAHRMMLSLLLALCLIFSLGTVAFAASYSGDDVYPGLSGIKPEDSLTLPEKTGWATLTATWGVRVIFVDWDETTLKTELVPVKDGVPGASSAPADPTREGYTFDGWERHDTNGDVNVTLNDDGTVTDVTGPGPVVYIATYTAVTGGDPAPGGDPTPGEDPAPGEDPTPGGDPTPGEDPTPGVDPTPGEDPTPGKMSLDPPDYWPDYDPESYPPEEYEQFFYFDESGVPLGFRPFEEVEDILEELVPLSGTLPQTGVLWWPVLVLFVSGVAVLYAGLAKRRKEAKGE